MSTKKEKLQGRRNFLSQSIKGMTGAFVLSQIPFNNGNSFPTIVPSGVLGATAPSERINVGVIGMGRIARSWDIPGTWKHNLARITAVCDLDSNRLQSGKKLVDDHYTKESGRSYNGTKAFGDYRELLIDNDIDAVLICTPDHWHSLAAVHAARAGKHIYMEKPSSLTIAAGRRVSDEVNRAGIVFQIGSQQRSLDPWPQFHRACELVRNGRIGKVHTVEVGLPTDNPDESMSEREMPIPKNLNYEMWSGSTPYSLYTENRVHPQEGFGRPGWLRCQQYGAGMITGWGAHHFDIVNWGLNTEYTGPTEVSCSEVVWPPKDALWDVHGAFKTETVFSTGVKVLSSDKYANGVKFIGSDGWIFVGRGAYSVTASDPESINKNKKSLDASDPNILQSEIGEDEIHLYKSKEHHLNWLECILSGRPTIAPAEVAHRACSICLLNGIAMKLRRKLYWDPAIERFKDDEEANAMLTRSERWPYQFDEQYNLKTFL